MRLPWQLAAALCAAAALAVAACSIDGGSFREPVCGNGEVEAGEGCDDGNTVTGEGRAVRQADNLATDAGAVNVFTRSGTTWSQHAYVKASNTDAGDLFGESVALSGDGAALAVGLLSRGQRGDRRRRRPGRQLRLVCRRGLRLPPTRFPVRS